MDKKSFAKDLIKFIDVSPTAFHATAEMEKRLKKAGFKKLDEKSEWDLKQGDAYYITRNDSALIAFVLGERAGGFLMVGSHSDSPTFKIKPAANMKVEGCYQKLNTEPYGGMIMSTWFDRPLSVAGRLSVKSGDPLNPKTVLVNVDKDLLIIPSLAIHMNRDINDGHKYSAQKEMLPLLNVDAKLAKAGEKGKASEVDFKKIVADAAGVKAEDILGADLYLYDRQPGALIGMGEELIQVGRLDNLAMAHVSIEALIDQAKKAKKNAPSYTAMIIVNDNEEVGSSSKQGAASPTLKNLLRRLSSVKIKGSEGQSKLEAESAYQISLAKSFIISADQAHAVHPNYSDTHDPTNRPILGGGVTIKHSASQRYTTDSDSAAVFKRLCNLAKVPYQEFVNHSDKRGGSTIGPITTSQIDVRGLDIGNPILAMHSIRELGHVDDHFGLYKVLIKYFEQCL